MARRTLKGDTLTTLVFDLFDITHASSQRDAIAIRAPKIRPATTRAGVVLDRWVTVAAPGDDETVEVEPGPAEIKFGRSPDAPVVQVVIPDMPKVRLSDLLDQGAVVEPTVVDRLWAAIRAGGEPEALAELAERVGVLEQREPAPGKDGQDGKDAPDLTPDLEALTKRVEALEAAHAAPAKPVEVMPATPGDQDALKWLRSTLTRYGQDYMVTELPFDIDSRQATNMHGMFASCSSLTSVPQMDTRNVTKMSNMFYNCSSLTTVPQMDTSRVTNMAYMFSYCRSLTDGNARLVGKHPDVNTTNMITNSGLTREPFYNTEGNPIT